MIGLLLVHYKQEYGFDKVALYHSIGLSSFMVLSLFVTCDMVESILIAIGTFISKRSSLAIMNIVLIISCFCMGIHMRSIEAHTVEIKYVEFRAVMTAEAIVDNMVGYELEKQSQIEDYSYGELIRSVCKVYGVDPNIMIAQYICESGFNERAVSHMGAKGIGQLMPSVYNKYRINPFDPVENIIVSVKYSSQLRQMFSNIPNREEREKLCILAYCSGPGAVLEAIKSAGTSNVHAVCNRLSPDSVIYMNRVWKYYPLVQWKQQFYDLKATSETKQKGLT